MFQIVVLYREIQRENNQYNIKIQIILGWIKTWGQPNKNIFSTPIKMLKK